MKNKVFVLTLALAALLLLAACNAVQESEPALVEPAAVEPAVGDGAAEEMPAEEMASQKTSSEEMASEEMAADPAEEVMTVDLPAWQTLELTNARTNEAFTLADFAGKTVFVEPMATWCTNCRRQLGNVKNAHAQLASDDVVFVALSVETTLGNGTLANYANEAGFDWLFAVVTPEMLQELANEFGQTIANPPATPHFVIRPDGSTTELVTGIEPAEQIVAQIQAAQG